MAQTAVLLNENVQFFFVHVLVGFDIVCMYGGTYAYMLACMHVRRHICIYARMYACIKAHMHICSHVCMRGGICVTFLFQNFIVHFRGGLKLCPLDTPPKL